jgi:hypothetical protein
MIWMIKVKKEKTFKNKRKLMMIKLMIRLLFKNNPIKKNKKSMKSKNSK